MTITKITGNMAMKLLKSPFADEFAKVLQNTKKEIIISTPFISIEGVDFLLNCVEKPNNKEIHLLTNLSPRNIVEKATQPSAILKIFDSFKTTNLFDLNKLHAKTYIIDDKIAVITSANLTKGGLLTNFEYGVLIDNNTHIKNLKHDIIEYSNIGHLYSEKFIKEIEFEAQKVKNIKKETANEKELKKLLQSQNNITKVLSSQYSDKQTRHGIFVKTTEFLLHKHSQLTTEELYNFIQELHPEMCDDNIKYSNGEKKWKIEVRQARFNLQKNNKVIQVPNQAHTWKLI